MAHVIFLHGASSSGKSTLARALQARLPTPFLHLSIDHFRDGGILPMEGFRSGAFDWAAARPGFFEGLHATAAALAGAGQDLILEHILDTPGWDARLRELLAPHDVYFVAIHCPVDVLSAREAARGDRAPGSAARDAATIHEGRRYDLELDGTAAVGGNLDRLIAGWSSGRRASDFAPGA